MSLIFNMSFRRQPTNRLERFPWLRMKLLVSKLQVQILSIHQDTILHSVNAYFLPWNCGRISVLPREIRKCALTWHQWFGFQPALSADASDDAGPAFCANAGRWPRGHWRCAGAELRQYYIFCLSQKVCSILDCILQSSVTYTRAEAHEEINQ